MDLFEAAMQSVNRSGPGPRMGSLAPTAIELSAWVPAIAWTEVDAAAGRLQLSLPSDLYLVVVYCGGELRCGEGDATGDLEVMVSSLRTRATPLSTQGRGLVVLALLTPEGAMRAFGESLREWVDRRVPLEQVCGRVEQRRLRDLIATAGDGEVRMRRLGAWIEGRIRGRRGPSPGETRVAQATGSMLRGGWRAGVLELAAALAVTRRQLEREFDRWLGLPPVAFSRLVRFQRAISAIAAGVSTIDAAIECGYADQSHLTRVVRQFSSMTPTEFRLDAARPGRALARMAMAGRVLTVSVGAASRVARPRHDAAPDLKVGCGVA